MNIFCSLPCHWQCWWYNGNTMGTHSGHEIAVQFVWKQRCQTGAAFMWALDSMSCHTCWLATLMSLRQSGLLSRGWHITWTVWTHVFPLTWSGILFLKLQNGYVDLKKSVTMASIALVVNTKMGEISVLDELSLEALFWGVTSRWATTERRMSAWYRHFANNEMLYKYDTNTLLWLYNILVISHSKLCVFALQI